MAELTISRRAITEKEREFFESEVRRWLDVLSLEEWDVEVVADEPGWRHGVINRLVRALGGAAGKASG